MSLKILVVTPTPTHPCDAGNRARIMNLVDALRDQGHELFLLHLEREKGDREEMSHWLGDGHFRCLPYRGAQRIESLWQRFWRRGRQLFDIDARHSWGIDDWYDPALSDEVANWRTETDFDVVIVEYAFLSRLLEDLPARVLRILDTHDRFANRHRLYLAQGLLPQFFRQPPRERKKRWTGPTSSSRFRRPSAQPSPLRPVLKC